MTDSVKSKQSKLKYAVNLMQTEMTDATELKLRTMSDLARPVGRDATDATSAIRSEKTDLDILVQRAWKN